MAIQYSNVNVTKHQQALKLIVKSDTPLANANATANYMHHFRR